MTGSSREFYGTGTNFLRYRYRYFFPGPIFSGTGTGTFFRDQFFPVLGPVLFSGTKFFRYRYRYFFPGPNFSGTGTGTFFRDQFFPVPVPVPPKRSKIPGTGNSRDWDVTLCCGPVWISWSRVWTRSSLGRNLMGTSG